MFSRKRRLESLLEIEKLSQICHDARFTKVVEQGRHLVTRSAIDLEEQGITSSCREYTLPRDDQNCYPKETIGDSTRIGPSMEAKLLQAGFFRFRNTFCNSGRRRNPSRN